MMVEVGQPAPDFAMPNADMQMVKLTDFLGKKVVLYFYPKDDTPGCTIEALEFTELMEEFTARDVIVLGVSKDNCQSHGAFRDRHGLTVQLLADLEGELCQKYGVWREKEKDGKTQMGILRSTFVIDRAGLIREAIYDVKPKGHAEAVLDRVKALD
jgi:thioredoxin-dependent peroxiredoxin